MILGEGSFFFVLVVLGSNFLFIRYIIVYIVFYSYYRRIIFIVFLGGECYDFRFLDKEI